MTDAELEDLEKKAVEIRKLILDSIGRLGIGHIGGSLSVVEVLTLLYFRHMRVDPENPSKPDRDKLVLSKGHAGPGLYAVLSLKGFFPKDWLLTLNRGGTRLPSHCDMRLTPGIDMTTGSLGQGLSAAVGLALANRMDRIDSRIYVILGDGETHEGQVWEAAMCAAHAGLDSITGFIDYNNMTVDGHTTDIMNIENIEDKWQSFGWITQRVNGHDFPAIDNAIGKAKKQTGKPSMIVLDTVKGKGAFFAEGNIANHNMAFTYEQALEAIRMLEAGLSGGGK
ncbi:MAG: transketolase [Spirochaetales bacterium]|nr:MAG: transketolase [Spirochaetales bacterium]